MLNAVSDIVFSHGGKKKCSAYVLLEILLAGWPLGPGAAPLRYAHPATPTRNPPASPLFIYLYTPIRRYKTGAAQEYPAFLQRLSPFSPTPRLAGARPPPPPPLSGSEAADTDASAHPWNALRYAASRCVFLRAEAERVRRRRRPNPCVPRVRRREREERLLGGLRGGD